VICRFDPACGPSTSTVLAERLTVDTATGIAEVPSG
jgi:hypothetical protein